MAVTLIGGRVVTPAGVLDPGWVAVRGSTISGLGAGAPPSGASAPPSVAGVPADRELVVDLTGAWVLPGFIDLHAHGGGGGDFATGGAGGARTAAEFHRAHGTTRLVASLLSAPPAETAAALAVLAPLVRAGELAGVHLEGPFLSPTYGGAHEAHHLRSPDLTELDALLSAGEGAVVCVTLAPELPGGCELVRRVVAAGVVAAIGHSDATYAEAVAAVDAGARLATHLFNAMRPWRHREPGIVGAVMDRREVVCELINDGAHLHDAAVRLAFGLGTSRVALVTDAVAPAGLGDGCYALGGRSVHARGGVVTVAGGATLAGSTLTMDRSVRRAVVDIGLAPEVVAEAAATTPARVLGLEGVAGALAVGLAADLVVLDSDWRVRRVMAGGRWVAEGALADKADVASPPYATLSPGTADRRPRNSR